MHPPRFDPQRLTELHQISGDSLVKPLQSLFQTSVPNQIDKLQSAFNQRDLPAICQAAHSLKSAAANVGAHQLSELALAIERACRDQTLNFDSPYIQELVDEFEAVLPYIVNFRA